MIYGALFATSLLYSLVLYRLARWCRPLVINRVCWWGLIWVGYTLVGVSYLISWEAWKRVAYAFGAAFVPMVIAHFVVCFLREQRLVEYLTEGGYDRAETLAAACGQSPDGSHSQGPGDRGEGTKD